MATLEVGGLLMVESVEGFHLFHEVELVPLPGERRGGLDSCTRLRHRNRKEYKYQKLLPLYDQFFV